MLRLASFFCVFIKNVRPVTLQTPQEDWPKTNTVRANDNKLIWASSIIGNALDLQSGLSGSNPAVSTKFGEWGCLGWPPRLHRGIRRVQISHSPPNFIRGYLMYLKRKLIVTLYKTFGWPYCDTEWRDRLRHNRRKLSQLYINLRKMKI